MTKKSTEWNKAFTQGYVCAVANAFQMHGCDTTARDTLKCIDAITVKKMKLYGVVDEDIKTLMPIIKELARRKKLMTLTRKNYAP